MNGTRKPSRRMVAREASRKGAWSHRRSLIAAFLGKGLVSRCAGVGCCDSRPTSAGWLLWRSFAVTCIVSAAYASWRVAHLLAAVNHPTLGENELVLGYDLPTIAAVAGHHQIVAAAGLDSPLLSSFGFPYHHAAPSRETLLSGFCSGAGPVLLSMLEWSAIRSALFLASRPSNESHSVIPTGMRFVGFPLTHYPQLKDFDALAAASNILVTPFWMVAEELAVAIDVKTACAPLLRGAGFPRRRKLVDDGSGGTAGGGKYPSGTTPWHPGYAVLGIQRLRACDGNGIGAGADQQPAAAAGVAISAPAPIAALHDDGTTTPAAGADVSNAGDDALAPPDNDGGGVDGVPADDADAGGPRRRVAQRAPPPLPPPSLMQQQQLLEPEPRAGKQRGGDRLSGEDASALLAAAAALIPHDDHAPRRGLLLLHPPGPNVRRRRPRPVRPKRDASTHLHERPVSSVFPCPSPFWDAAFASVSTPPSRNTRLGPGLWHTFDAIADGVGSLAREIVVSDPRDWGFEQTSVLINAVRYTKYPKQDINVPATLRALQASSGPDYGLLKRAFMPVRSHASVPHMLTLVNAVIDENGIISAPGIKQDWMKLGGCGARMPTPRFHVRPGSQYNEVLSLTHSWGHNSYHFLGEAFTRLLPFLPLIRSKPHLRIHLWSSAEHPSPPKVAYKALSVLGLNPDAIIRVRSPIAARVLYVPDGVMCAHPHPLSMVISREAIRNAVKLPPSPVRRAARRRQRAAAASSVDSSSSDSSNRDALSRASSGRRGSSGSRGGGSTGVLRANRAPVDPPDQRQQQEEEGSDYTSPRLPRGQAAAGAGVDSLTAPPRRRRPRTALEPAAGVNDADADADGGNVIPPSLPRRRGPPVVDEEDGDLRITQRNREKSSALDARPRRRDPLRDAAAAPVAAMVNLPPTGGGRSRSRRDQEDLVEGLADYEEEEGDAATADADAGVAADMSADAEGRYDIEEEGDAADAAAPVIAQRRPPRAARRVGDFGGDGLGRRVKLLPGTASLGEEEEQEEEVRVYPPPPRRRRPAADAEAGDVSAFSDVEDTAGDAEEGEETAPAPAAAAPVRPRPRQLGATEAADAAASLSRSRKSAALNGAAEDGEVDGAAAEDPTLDSDETTAGGATEDVAAATIGEDYGAMPPDGDGSRGEEYTGADVESGSGGAAAAQSLDASLSGALMKCPETGAQRSKEAIPYPDPSTFSPLHRSSGATDGCLEGVTGRAGGPVRILMHKRSFSRRILNHVELEAALRALPATVDVMDDTALASQTDIWRQHGEADIIVAMNGAGLANLHAASAGTAVFEVVPFCHLSLHYAHAALGLDLDYHGFISMTKKFDDMLVPVDSFVRSVCTYATARRDRG